MTPALAHPSSDPRNPARDEVFWCSASVIFPSAAVAAPRSASSAAGAIRISRLDSMVAGIIAPDFERRFRVMIPLVPVTRRNFLKSAAAGGVAVSVLGFDLEPAYAAVRELKISRTTETRSTCPYCSVSCGVIIHTLGDRSRNVKPTVVHVEGDPDHPINQGTLCPKGITLKHNIVNDRRLTKVLYRAPGSAAWEEKDWEFALEPDGAAVQGDPRSDAPAERRQPAAR